MTDRGKKIKEAFFKKYGVYHPSQLPSVKEKIKQKRESGAYDNMVVKMKRTLSEKYGDENYNNSEKAKLTKLERYGDENYNNREKMVQTNNKKYGMSVSPNTLKKTKERSSNGDIGFKSEKYQKYLYDNNISNVSQLEAVKQQKLVRKINKTIATIFDGGRLKNIVIPLFQRDEYIGGGYAIMYKFRCCKCNNTFEDNLYSGNIPRCLICYPHKRFSSSIETNILNFLNSHGVKCKQHDRTILDGEEIDIYLPDFNLGIECDGIYWHSEVSGGKDKKYHLLKTQKCLEKNIELLHIWDWEWISKQNIIKSILLNKIGKSTVIYARKCTIAEVSDADKVLFLEENHIQRNDTASIRLGLYYESRLVSIMTFVKSRYDKKYEYELSRYCNLLNTHVIGGASKLFSHFTKKNNINSVVTYSDRRLFTGGVYKNMGMKFHGNTPQSYHYFHKSKCVPIHRTHFQKHKLKEKLALFDSNLTEWENMQISGYDRIWDCGHGKFVWNRVVAADVMVK